MHAINSMSLKALNYTTINVMLICCAVYSPCGMKNLKSTNVSNQTSDSHPDILPKGDLKIENKSIFNNVTNSFLVYFFGCISLKVHCTSLSSYNSNMYPRKNKKILKPQFFPGLLNHSLKSSYICKITQKHLFHKVHLFLRSALNKSKLKVYILCKYIYLKYEKVHLLARVEYVYIKMRSNYSKYLAFKMEAKQKCITFLCIFIYAYNMYIMIFLIKRETPSIHNIAWYMYITLPYMYILENNSRCSTCRKWKHFFKELYRAENIKLQMYFFLNNFVTFVFVCMFILIQNTSISCTLCWCWFMIINIYLWNNCFANINFFLKPGWYNLENIKSVSIKSELKRSNVYGTRDPCFSTINNTGSVFRTSKITTKKHKSVVETLIRSYVVPIINIYFIQYWNVESKLKRCINKRTKQSKIVEAKVRDIVVQQVNSSLRNDTGRKSITISEAKYRRTVSINSRSKTGLYNNRKMEFPYYKYILNAWEMVDCGYINSNSLNMNIKLKIKSKVKYVMKDNTEVIYFVKNEYMHVAFKVIKIYLHTYPNLAQDQNDQ